MVPPGRIEESNQKQKQRKKEKRFIPGPANDVPATIPAAGQVKWNVSVGEIILTDEAVEMVRTPVLRLVGVDSGRGAEEIQQSPCPLEIGSDGDATAALSEKRSQ